MKPCAADGCERQALSAIANMCKKHDADNYLHKPPKDDIEVRDRTVIVTPKPKWRY